MNDSNQNNLPIICLRVGAFLCFAGWTWVNYYWEGPYGVLLWHDATFQLATRFGLTWDEFVGSGANDGFVQKLIANIWWLFLACALLSITVRKNSWIQMSGLVFGSGLLTLLSFAAYVSSQNQLPMFIEHGGQMLIPLLLVMALVLGAGHRVTVTTAIIAVILTFAGHGSYALGLWPTPGNFYAMTTLILGAEYPTAQTILRTAGVLDFLVCIGICIPYLRCASALYATVWGFLTAIARPVAGMSWGLNYWGADQYLHEAVLRAPHFLIPLYLLLLWRQPHHTEALALCHLPQRASAPDQPDTPNEAASRRWLTYTSPGKGVRHQKCREKVSDTKSAKHPKGRSGFWCRTPFPGHLFPDNP